MNKISLAGWKPSRSSCDRSGRNALMSNCFGLKIEAIDVPGNRGIHVQRRVGRRDIIDVKTRKPKIRLHYRSLTVTTY